MALPETTYHITIDDNGKLTKFVIKGEDVDEWIELVALRKYYKRDDVLAYYISGTNSNPLHLTPYYEDQRCKCTKTLARQLIVTIREVTK